MFKFRSVKSIVIAPAKTGRENNNKKEVTNIDQIKRGKRSKIRPENRIIKTVVIKLIELRIEETPPKCREKIARSTEKSVWKMIEDKGG